MRIEGASTRVSAVSHYREHNVNFETLRAGLVRRGSDWDALHGGLC